MNLVAEQTSPQHPLGAFFRPRSVAVIGATDRAGSVGRAVLENLGCFSGAVYPVTPAHSEVLGRRCYAKLGDIDEPPDLAVIVVPAAAVPSVVRECAALGVNAAIIISAGFREAGADGAALEREVLAAAEGRVRLLGPNCLGAMSPHHGLNATFAAGMTLPGRVACISQSGALCTAILDWSLREKIGFSALVSTGAMADIGWGDLIDYFGNDPHTASIVCYMESVGDARAFLSAARNVASRKPIVILKVGQTAAGARAAASHTGALTGSDEVVSAAFQRAGVLRVHSIEELFDMAEVLARQPRPRGPRLAILTNAGGPAALAADQTITSGASLAELSASTLRMLDTILPHNWSHGNPVDILGAADGSLYGRAAEVLLRDDGIDGLLVVLTPQSMTQPEQTADELIKAATGCTKPILASWMGGDAVAESRTILGAAGIATYDYPDAAAQAFAMMWRHSNHLTTLRERPIHSPSDPHIEPSHRVATMLIEEVRRSGRTLLSEREANQVLAAYGIPVATTESARTEDEAVAAAERMGFPVALKLWSHTLTHKARFGGVRLNVQNAVQVRDAWRGIREAVAASASANDFIGVVVQPMIEPGGIELILGSSIDPQFGPVILFGAGGSLVEVLGDRALALPPLDTTLARRLIEQTRIYAALNGKGRRAPVDLPALEDILVRFSHLVVEQRWISEIEVNPLLISAQGAVALDARAVLHPASTAEDQLPRLALTESDKSTRV